MATVLTTIARKNTTGLNPAITVAYSLELPLETALIRTTHKGLALPQGMAKLASSSIKDFPSGKTRLETPFI